MPCTPTAADLGEPERHDAARTIPRRRAKTRLRQRSSASASIEVLRRRSTAACTDRAAACRTGSGGVRTGVCQNAAMAAAHQQHLCGRHAADAAAFRRRGIRRCRAGRRSTIPGHTSCRCRTRCDACCRSCRTRMLRNTRSTIQNGYSFPNGDHLFERDSPVRARLSSRASSMRGCWLIGPMNRPANRNDSAGVVVPEPQQRFQQIGPAQERAVLRAHRRTHGDVVAAAGADMPPVEHELLRRRDRPGGLPRTAVRYISRCSDQLVVGCNIDLDDARVGGHREARAGADRRAADSPPGTPCRPSSFGGGFDRGRPDRANPPAAYSGGKKYVDHAAACFHRESAVRTRSGSSASSSKISSSACCVLL